MNNESNIKTITAALCIPIVMACIDVMALSVALDAIVKEFRTPIYQTQWLFTAYMITNSAFLIVIGRLADKYGRRLFLLLGISGFIIASLIAACSFSLWALVFARLMQGLASAAIVTTSISLITQNFGLPQRNQIFAKWIFSVGLGLAFGPLIGGVIVYFINWRFIFLINLPIGIISYWLVIKFITESKSDKLLERAHLLNAFCLCVAIFFLSAFLSQGDAWGWLSEYSVGAMLAFIVSLLLFIYLEMKNDTSTMHWELYKEKSFLTGLFSGFFAYFFMYAWLFIFSLYLQEVRGLTSLSASIICISYSIAFAFGPLIINKYCAKVSESKCIKFSFICAAISFVLMSINPMTASYVVLMFAFCMLGLAVATINVSSMALATRDIPKNVSGFVSGIIFTVRWLGGALGVVIMTIIFHSISTSWLREKLKSGSYANQLVDLSHKSLTVGLSFSFIILAIISIICFSIVNVISSSKNKSLKIC